MVLRCIVMVCASANANGHGMEGGGAYWRSQ